MTAGNLLRQTIDSLADNQVDSGGVRWVGSRDGKYCISWEEFAELARDVDYDCGYGGQEIAHDLVVVGDSWWMERGEYDGSEWWEFKTTPTRHPEAKKFNRVTASNGEGWVSVGQCMGER